jgi:Trypsin-like peptidase domain
MLTIDESVADRPDLQGAYFDGSLELLRPLTVTTDLDAALPRLSAIANKMLTHDASRMACFDQRGQLVVNAATADVLDLTMSGGEDVFIDDVRTRALGASAAPHAAERLVGAGYGYALGVSTRELVRSVSGFSAELGVRTMARGRVAVPVVAVAFAVLFFGLGSYLGARPSVDPQLELAAQRATIVADVKRQLQTEMGLLPLTLIRDRRQSFVALYSYDDRGASSYGTAGYLGNGYFITVKHGVVALDRDGASDPRVIDSIQLMIDGRPISARVVDAGDARVEVDPGDWAILEVEENIDLPALAVGLNYPFEFADPIFRLGNDYSKGIVVSTGYVGQRTPEKLVTCLTDGHPGVSGGGVLNAEGRLVGIPVGRMPGDFRFSFILPLREEMFQKVRFGA